MTSRHIVPITICVDDCKTVLQFRQVFSLMERAAYAVKAKGGRVIQMSLRNEPNATTNPAGDLSDVEFEILLPYTVKAVEFVLTCVSEEVLGEVQVFPLVELRVTL